MTTLTTTPTLTASTRPTPWYLHRTIHFFFLLAIAFLLAYDRFRLCTEYLFKYLDEDQACMWYAAHDLLHNHRIAEPAFYGQDYNSLLEGFLATPLIALHVPYNIACPLTTVLLGLLPFLLIACIAARRGRPLTAAAALLIPLLLPIRYGMIAGIPRGFINGIAVATIPMILLLPPPTPSLNTPTRPRSKFSKWLPALRYFFAAFFAVVALQVNPNCALLLVPVAVYALLTRFFQWKLWLFTPLGLLAAAPYPYYVHQFYHVTHTDYILYLRDVVYHWGYRYFLIYLHFAAPKSGPSPVFADLVPFPISAAQSAHFLLAAFITLAVLLLFRLRIPAFLAALSAIAITFLSFAYERINDGQPSNTASYPYARMFLALPVLFLWLLFLLNHKPWKHLAKLRWLTPIALALVFAAGLYACILKQQQLPAALRAEINAPGFVICPAIPVAQLNAAALEIQRVAHTRHADLLIIGGGDRQKYLAYAIPALLNLETLFPDFERRTFRLHEENTAAHDNILFIHYPIPHATLAGGGNVLKADDHGNLFDPRTSPSESTRPDLHSLLIPPIFLLPAHHSNAYHLPELRDRMPPFFTPDPTPENPHPTPLIDRPSW